MTAQPVTTFADQYRAAGDHVYLLIDPLAECDRDHPLSTVSLIRKLGEDAVERVLRPDLAHTPDACPALVQLAAPGTAPARRYLELSAHYALDDLAHNKRYLCGWLLSPEPLTAIAQHIATRCSLSSSSSSKAMTPWYEPLRLELLTAALGREVGNVLTPISAWLLPTNWGSFSILRGVATTPHRDQSELVRTTQHLAQLVGDVLGAWRLAQQQHLPFAPWRWNGPRLLPAQAALHAFRLVHDARQRGLRHSHDIITLSLHRVCIHPHLPRHPDIQRDIAETANGITPLQDRFETYDDFAWKRIVASLPRAENYS